MVQFQHLEKATDDPLFLAQCVFTQVFWCQIYGRKTVQAGEACHMVELWQQTEHFFKQAIVS